MMEYGFGYDPEVPGGYQDADIEMRELEDAAADEAERERDLIEQYVKATRYGMEYAA